MSSTDIWSIQCLDKLSHLTPLLERGAYAVLMDAGLERFQRVFAPHVVPVRGQFLSHFSAVELAQMAAVWRRVKQGHVQSEAAESEAGDPA